MCGIVGAISQQDVTPLLLEGLARLEYRGYDSAGVALIGKAGKLQRIRRPGKVAELRQACQEAMPAGHLGIAHTRWATHGVPSEANAHPQMSGPVAVVHNGIIENHEALRAQLAGQGFCFESDTDTEVIAHQLNAELAITDDLVVAMRSLLGKLEGAYAIAVIHEDYPDRLMAARLGSNLVVGIGDGEHYVASDPQALRSVTSRFVFPDDGELVAVTRTEVTLFDLAEDVTGSASRQPTPQPLAQRIVTLGEDHGAGDKGNYQHYMLKEIHEQPEAVARTLSGRITTKHVLPQAFGAGAAAVFAQVRAVRITACGSSYYAGLVAQYWFEQYAGVPCQVEIASELRYRPTVVSEGTLLVTLSQSGETADTLAALRNATDPNYIASLCLCNVPNSSLVRASDFSMMLEAGAEICVASTKAFMAQATDLLMLVAAVGRENALTEEGHNELVSALHQLPELLNETLKLEPDIKRMAASFVDKHHALFPGPGHSLPHCPGRRAETQGVVLYSRRGLPRRRTQARPPGTGR